MPEISLTDFVDFVAKSGSPKLTLVRQLKSRGDYDPVEDFWRKLRMGIVEFHEKSKEKSWLDGITAGLTDIKKIKNYPNVIAQYKSFLGRKAITWFKPPFIHWKHGGLDVRVNPELGLVINGKRHIVKLYFKNAPLTKNKADMILLLMKDTLPTLKEGDIMCILDLPRKKLFSSAEPDEALMPLLQGEAASLATIWSQLP